MVSFTCFPKLTKWTSVPYYRASGGFPCWRQGPQLDVGLDVYMVDLDVNDILDIYTKLLSWILNHKLL